MKRKDFLNFYLIDQLSQGVDLTILKTGINGVGYFRTTQKILSEKQNLKKYPPKSLFI